MIELPPGFTLDNAETPQSITPEMTRQICANQIKISSDGHQLVYDRNFYFGGGNSILFPVTSYPAVKQLFDLVNQSNEHTITLKLNAGN